MTDLYCTKENLAVWAKPAVCATYSEDDMSSTRRMRAKAYRAAAAGKRIKTRRWMVHLPKRRAAALPACGGFQEMISIAIRQPYGAPVVFAQHFSCSLWNRF